MSMFVSMTNGGGAVYWLTDAGQYDPADGTLVATRRKVYHLPGGVAFAWRGAGGDWPDMIADALRPLRTFDRMALALPGIMAAVAEGDPEDVPEGGWVMEVHLAGPSVLGDRVAAVWVSSRDRPFQLQEEPVLSIAPAPAAPLFDVLGYEPAAEMIAHIDHAADGMKIVDAIRRSPQAGGFIVAGGWVDWTVIDFAGTETVTLREWPDIIGRPIGSE